MNRLCHDLKDKDTPLRFYVLQAQMAGTTITFEQHRQLFLREGGPA